MYYMYCTYFILRFLLNFFDTTFQETLILNINKIFISSQKPDNIKSLLNSAKTKFSE